LQRDGRGRRLESVFAGIALDGKAYDATGLVFRLESGFFQNMSRQVCRVL